MTAPREPGFYWAKAKTLAHGEWTLVRYLGDGCVRFPGPYTDAFGGYVTHSQFSNHDQWFPELYPDRVVRQRVEWGPRVPSPDEKAAGCAACGNPLKPRTYCIHCE